MKLIQKSVWHARKGIVETSAVVGAAPAATAAAAGALHVIARVILQVNQQGAKQQQLHAHKKIK